MIVFDHVGDPLATFHPQLDQLSKHLEDSLARAHVLLFEKGRGDTIKLEPEDVLLPVPLLLKVHRLRFRTKWPDFNGRVVRVVRKASGR